MTALANEHRRRVLVALLDWDGGSDPRVDVIQTVESGGERTDELRTRLYHRHLPRLDELGFIEWDRDSLAVRPGPRYQDIRPGLEVLRDNASELPGDWP